jgi:hypothetical protein
MAAKKAPGTYEELTELLWEAARNGNVPAMRILRIEMRGEREDTVENTSIIDELAGKRTKKAATG